MQIIVFCVAYADVGLLLEVSIVFGVANKPTAPIWGVSIVFCVTDDSTPVVVDLSIVFCVATSTSSVGVGMSDALLLYKRIVFCASIDCVYWGVASRWVYRLGSGVIKSIHFEHLIDFL